MNPDPSTGSLSPEEKLKNASRDLLRFAEAFCAWCFTPDLMPTRELIEAGFAAVKKAGGKLPGSEDDPAELSAKMGPEPEV